MMIASPLNKPGEFPSGNLQLSVTLIPWFYFTKLLNSGRKFVAALNCISVNS